MLARAQLRMPVAQCWVLRLVLALPACSPPASEGIRRLDAFGTFGAAGVEGFAPGDGGVADAEPLAFAVVASDYTTTSISLLQPDGTLLARGWVHSGSAAPGLVTALSGDVVLPTRSGEPEHLVLIDRFRTDVITRIDPRRGVLGQVKTHASNAERDQAYASNPYDYVYLDAHSAWVTRFEPKLGAEPGDPDRGNDLLYLDPTRFERTGRRIDFDALNGRGLRHNPVTGATQEVIVYARPSGMVRLGRFLVVGLGRMSQSFDVLGEGMVALVDLEAERVEGLPLPGLSSCGKVVPMPDDPARVAVACTGSYRGDQREGGGLAILKLADGVLHVEHLWRAREHPEAPLTVSGLVALGAHEVIAVAAGQVERTESSGKRVPETWDRAYVVDVAAGRHTLLFEAKGPFKIGAGAYNPRRRLLLIPDASTDAAKRPIAGVHRFERQDDGTFQAIDVVVIDDVLPPRQVAPL